MKKHLALVGAVTALSLASLGANAHSSSFEGATRDAWITGKVQMALLLNAHLNPFAIDTDVTNGVVHLTGLVGDDIDKDLAGQVAKGVDGVVSVDNDLKVDAAGAVAAAKERRTGKRDFASWVDDATTTAAIKSKLVANRNTEGFKIGVETRDDVVTLSGRVNSIEERALAEQIARNTGDTKDVHNDLVVDPK
jgi:hyperosmotically inducible protein